MYKQAIIVFGIAIPGAALLLALIVMWTMLGNFEVKQTVKVAALEQTNQARLKQKMLVAKLMPHRGQMEYWDEHLGVDVVQSLNETLDVVLEKYKANQLRMTSARRPPGGGVLGADTESDSLVFELAFEGGYGPMQEMLAELEIRMPQLVLEKISVSLNQGGGKKNEANLIFNLTYMAWAKY